MSLWLFICAWLYINYCSKAICTYSTISSDNYALVVSYETFYVAQEICSSLFGTTLASIHNHLHSNEIYDLLHSYWSSNISDSTNTWIGLTDEYLEGHYIWIDGQPLNYSNSLSTAKTEFDCISVQNLNTAWYQNHCENQYPFICNTNIAWTKPIDLTFLSPLTSFSLDNCIDLLLTKFANIIIFDIN